ncbi:MAG: polysaccharide deacetylase family protein [Coriobacteriia bacterium]|nr:polysaccharide deacetylase family protein [Coriobacteriia bacterium]
MSDNKNIDELAQYKDVSRYSAGAKNSINLGSNNYSRNNNSQPRHEEVPDADKEITYKAAQYSRESDRKYSHKRIQKKKNRKKRKAVYASVLSVIVIAIIGLIAYKFWPITVTINGQEQTLTYDKSIKQAVDQSQIKVHPGNYVAVDFSVLKRNEGYEFYANVNDNDIDNLNYELKDGDTVKYEDGKDKMEDYTSIKEEIPAAAKIVGTGAIHKFIGTGEPGIWSQMTGKESKKYAERMTEEPHDITCKNYNPNPGKDKVIALTFDDGPSEEYTNKILDLLQKYNAKATFFVIGEQVEEDYGKSLVAKENAAGHLVCTHTYDHGRAVGGTDITSMSAEKQIMEVTKGQETIAKALGNKQVSTICRLPGGNINAVTLRCIGKYVTAEMGWSLDTKDWTCPGKEKILSALNQSSSGEIILCHDGGGERSQTVAAVEEFLKSYTEKGYKFITVEEMMNYPESPQSEN